MHLRGWSAAICLALLAACTSSGVLGDGADVTSQTTKAPRTTASSAIDETTTTPTTDAAPSATTPDATAAPSTAAPSAQIAWYECGDHLDCGTIDVPFDYEDPSVGTFTLQLVRARARNESERIGSLLVNPGGPGFGGTYLATSADAIFSEDIVNHFDIVAWDPRGTDSSTPAVDCVDSFDAYFAIDITPDDDVEQQSLVDAARAFEDGCVARSGDILGHISTARSARDMDTIRRALGEEQISYLGFSYGSELGAVWATIFPDTVRAAVFDGSANVNADYVQRAIDQAKGFELALDAFLDACVDECEFAQGGDPGAAFDQIFADIEANSYPTRPGRPALNHGIAYSAVIKSLYLEYEWDTLAHALEAARTGDGGPLLDLYDAYFQARADGSYGDELEAFIAIVCGDDPGPQSVETIDEFNDDIVTAAPRMGPAFTHAYSCIDWPATGEPRVEVTGKGLGPILVIGTTNDPATPYETTKLMADTFERGILVSVDGNGHLGYQQSKCARDVADRYLVDLELPDGDVDCG